MCRLLYIKTDSVTDCSQTVNQFAQMCKNSKEYQGHGWGYAWLNNDKWHIYKSIKPIWEDELTTIPKTDKLLVHARSAFRNKDIIIENNMPFTNANHVFIFNGELHGVKIKENGRIGAEKIFNFIMRFYKGDLYTACNKALPIIKKRSTYVKAMNILIADNKNTICCSHYSEDAEYFSLKYKEEGHRLTLCSQIIDDGKWQFFNNNSIKEI